MKYRRPHKTSSGFKFFCHTTPKQLTKNISAFIKSPESFCEQIHKHAIFGATELFCPTPLTEGSTISSTHYTFIPAKFGAAALKFLFLS